MAYTNCGGGFQQADMGVSAKLGTARSLTVVARDQISYQPFNLVGGQILAFDTLTLSFQTDGNLVLYRDAGLSDQIAVWSSGTFGRNCSAGCVAALQTDGNLVLYQNGQAYWNTGTNGLPNPTLMISQHPPYISVQSNGQTFWYANTNLNWFTSIDPYGGYGSGRPGAVDYMDLFQAGSDWQNSLKQINVLKVYAQLLENGPDQQLRQIFSFLKDNHIALAVEFGAFTSPGNCGINVEGTGGQSLAAQISARVQQLGGQIDFVAMDEPVYYEHYNTTSTPSPWNSCQMPFAALAQNLVQTASVFRQYFPAIIIGDIEPFSQMPSSTSWASDYGQFADAFKAANNGAPLGFAHDDAAVESTAWQQRIGGLQSLLAQRKIAYGLIRNGNGSSDATWVQSALDRINIYNSLNLPAPAHNIFQSWDPYPTHDLSETSPTALTYVANSFFQMQGSYAQAAQAAQAAQNAINTATQVSLSQASTQTATFITQLYSGLLSRAPDAGGFQNWVSYASSSGATCS